jgi:hypothetical protein
MSNYRDFVSDFPGRCGDLLDSFLKPAKHQRREVTLLLCLSAASLVIPLERLKGAGAHRTGHPARDWEKFQQAKSRLDELGQVPFRGSPIWPDASEESWHFGSLSTVAGGPDSWPELHRPKLLTRDKKVRSVLQHLRNALAHGNIFTRGAPDIDQLILISEDGMGTGRYSFLMVSPAGFEQFLRHWIAFVRELRVPADVVPLSIDAEAWFTDSTVALPETVPTHPLL